jgi:DNA-directed RNA polymerase beta subunit
MSIEEDEIFTKIDMQALLQNIIKEIGINKHHISTYNELLNHGISDILTNSFKIRQPINTDRFTEKTGEEKTADGVKISGYVLWIDFRNVTVLKPTTTKYLQSNSEVLYPTYAMRNGLTYAGMIRATIDIKIIANCVDQSVREINTTLENVSLGAMPIMTGTDKCNTYYLSKNSLQKIGEDPLDIGGNFVAVGYLYIIDCTENIRYNYSHIYADMVANEKVRLEIISRAGNVYENSSQVVIRHHTDGQLTIEIKSNKFKKGVEFPFYLIYRIFDMNSDLDIVNTIIISQDVKSPVNDSIKKFLYDAFQTCKPEWADLKTTLSADVIIRKMYTRLTANANKAFDATDITGLDVEVLKYINNDLLSKLDSVFLPHMGLGKEHRIYKLKYLGELIRELFLVHLGSKPVSDRDNLANKRMHGPGVSLAKALKTHFNVHICGPMRKAIASELAAKPFSQIRAENISAIARNSIQPSGFSKAMEQQITTNTENITVEGKKTTNRTSSQQVERKNNLHAQTSQRIIVSGTGKSSNKSSTRADEMRRVHPSFFGFICVCQSSESGENVGMRKQLAITAAICGEGDSADLKTNLLAEPDVIKLSNIKHGVNGIDEFNICKIFVNGEYIGGYNGNAYVLANKYREKRRKLEIDRYTSICVDNLTNKLDFCLDIGRIIRPVLIVYNNIEECDSDPSVKFVQKTRLTRKIIADIYAGKCGLEYLIENGIMEYITPDELSNCYFADSIITLQKEKHNITNRFTHCEIEQAILGYSALIVPFGHNSQPSRIILATNHQRQAAGWFTINFPFAIDKNRFFQRYTQMPIVRTLTNNIMLPNGLNTIVAYTNYMGENQEDSCVLSKAFIDSGGFDGMFYKTETVKLEKGCELATPNFATTKGYKTNANYGKLVDGLVKIGTIIEHGDIIIGIIEKIVKTKTSQIDDKQIHTHIDKSKQYMLNEVAVVEDVYTCRDSNDNKSCVVKLGVYRKIATGDKLASRSGNKSIAAHIVSESDMIFTEDGVPVDIVVNPHSFPTRMAIGQLYEGMASIVGAYTGKSINGTTFLDIYAEDFVREIESLGLGYCGLKTAYNGITGEPFDIAMFIAPTYQQRLQKFVNDDEQSVGLRATLDPITKQPVRGKLVAGGLKLGEMEVAALFSHGVCGIYIEKIHVDSNGCDSYICRGCQYVAVVNKNKGIYQCKNCKSYADIEKLPTTYSALIIQYYLATCGVDFKQKIKPREF